MAKTRLTVFLSLLLLFGCSAGQLQADACGEELLPSGTSCLACDGERRTRVYGGPDGWCEYDGETCACHGHGIGDECGRAVEDFAACGAP